MRHITILLVGSLFSISAHCWTANVTIRTGKDGKTVQKFGYVKNEIKLNQHKIATPKPFKCEITLNGIMPGEPSELQSPRNVDVQCSVGMTDDAIIMHNFRCATNDDGIGLSYKGIISLISVSCEDD